ncbi:MAG: hypothetical protein V3W01_00735 [Dehalococcoidales bacterium]
MIEMARRLSPMNLRGLKLLALILTVLIVTLAGCAEQGIKTLTEDNFKTLLTVEDIESVLTSMVVLKTEFSDYKKLAESVDPAQVVNMDNWYGMGFDTEDGIKGLTFSVIDFDSQTSAQGHFGMMTAETLGLEIMDSPIGDTSAEVEVNAQGIGSVVVFIKDDKVIQLHTVQLDGEQPLTDLNGLEKLAKIVAGRLQ